VATPLAVVLTELMQNAVDHAYPHPPDGERPTEGQVTVCFRPEGGDLVIRVLDDGVGLPAGFSLTRSSGLGLSIVRSLVTSQIFGSIDMATRPTGGTEVTLRVPLVATAPE
jgi:two-component sensor histidine kinase